MFSQQKELPIIISVGGGLIVPNGGIDSNFLKKLNTFIRGQVKKGKRFFLVAGGGRTARHYRDAGKAVVGDMTDEDLDWLGIHATHLNGHLLRTIFQDISNPRIIQNYDKKLTNWKEPIVIAAGWKPGWSTDYCAVKLAEDYGANLVINLSNIDWVYTKDPRVHPDAQPIKKLTWTEMEDLVGTKWVPGMNAPFDPIAAQLAKKLDLTVIVTNGNDFKNFENILEFESFKGTVIMPYRIDGTFYDREYYEGKKSKHRLGKKATVVASLFHGVTNAYRAFLIKTFINPKNALDIGCGDGNLVDWLRFFGVDAYGVEISKHALKLVNPKIKEYVKEADLTDLPFKNGEFNLVLSFDVMEHVERGKIKKAANEAARVAKKYILHKIYTRENLWITWMHRKDYSHVSVMPKVRWQSIFSDLEHVSVLKNSFFRLPLFMETIFLLKKK